MKNFFMLLILVSACLIQVNAQISITSSDIASFYTVGNTFIASSDTTEVTVDIGAPGAGNVWDFSNLSADITIENTIVDAAGSPFEDIFPDAQVAVRSLIEEVEGSVESFNYFSIDNEAFINYGLGASTVIEDVMGETRGIFDPGQSAYNFPATFGTTWEYEGTFTNDFIIGGIPVVSTVLEANIVSEIDAYGTIIFPDGVSREGLRLKQTTEFISETVPGFPEVTESVDFIFTAKNGFSVSVSSSNLQANEGEVTGTVSWTGTNESTNTVDLSALGYQLGRVFPNPVQGQAQIELFLPQNTAIDLSIYDLKGRKMKTILNGQQAPGAHTLNITDEGLANGMYFLRLNAVGGQLTQKVLIAK